MEELWQLYDKQGRVLVGQGANKDDVFDKALLHGASHVWIWRKNDNVTEVLLQKRASNKRTWPNMYDISAAGHIDLGEEPIIAAIREADEEIGLKVEDKDLELIAVERRNIVAPNGATENEFCWVYILHLYMSDVFKLQESEVTSLSWKMLSEFKDETFNSSENQYVPHGSKYFNTVISAIESASAS